MWSNSPIIVESSGWKVRGESGTWGVKSERGKWEMKGEKWEGKVRVELKDESWRMKMRGQSGRGKWGEGWKVRGKNESWGVKSERGKWGERWKWELMGENWEGKVKSWGVKIERKKWELKGEKLEGKVRVEWWRVRGRSESHRVKSERGKWVEGLKVGGESESWGVKIEREKWELKGEKWEGKVRVEWWGVRGGSESCRVKSVRGKWGGGIKGRICYFCEPMHDALLITEGLTKDPIIRTMLFLHLATFLILFVYSYVCIWHLYRYVFRLRLDAPFDNMNEINDIILMSSVKIDTILWFSTVLPANQCRPIDHTRHHHFRGKEVHPAVPLSCFLH